MDPKSYILDILIFWVHNVSLKSVFVFLLYVIFLHSKTGSEALHASTLNLYFLGLRSVGLQSFVNASGSVWPGLRCDRNLAC